MSIKYFHFRFNSRTKFVLGALFVGTAVIFAIAVFAINDIRYKMDKSYSDFAQLMSATLAIESAEFTRGVSLEEKQNILKRHAALIIQGNEDVSFVIFKDGNNNIIYSSKTDFPVNDEETIVSVSSPVILSKNNRLAGSVTVGMT